MEHGELTRALRDRREPGILGGRRRATRASSSGTSTRLIVQDIFMTRTAEDGRRRPAGLQLGVASPRARSPTASGGSSASARRSNRRATREDDIWIIARARAAARAGLGRGHAASAWDELRAALADARRDDLRTPRGARGDPVAVLRRGARGDAVPARPAVGGAGISAAPRRRSASTPFEPPVDELTEEFPLRLTTGRRLDSYNTGVQTGGYTSPLRRGETHRHVARGRRSARRCGG